MAMALCLAPSAKADLTVGPTSDIGDWIGFMNVYNLDNSPNFGSGWGLDYMNNGPNDIGAGYGTNELMMRAASIGYTPFESKVSAASSDNRIVSSGLILRLACRASTPCLPRKAVKQSPKNDSVSRSHLIRS